MSTGKVGRIEWRSTCVDREKKPGIILLLSKKLCVKTLVVEQFVAVEFVIEPTERFSLSRLIVGEW